MDDRSQKEEKEVHEEGGAGIVSVNGTNEKNDTPLASTGEIDAQTEKRIRRKFDLHIVPILFGCWLLAFLDRANIGNAAIAGLEESANAGGNKFNTALAIFYMQVLPRRKNPYILWDIPSNLVLKYLRAGYYIPGLLIAWGLVATFTGKNADSRAMKILLTNDTGFVTSYGGLIAARFFLGLCEGGLLGGMVIYLAMFYKRHEIGFRIGLFYCAAPLSGAWGGLLSSGLAEIMTPGYPGWPFIFFVEGAITVVYGLIVIWFLPHTPQDAKFLTEEERQWATARLLSDSSGAASKDAKYETFSWAKFRRALLNVNTLLMSLAFFCLITPIYSFSLFLPIILDEFGYSLWQTQLLTVPPNMAAFFTVLLTCWLSDKTKRRGLFMLGWIVIAIIGYIMLIATPNTNIEYGGTFFVAAGIFPCSPLIMGWLANNLAPHYIRATGTGFQIMIANCAAFIATFTYTETQAPRYITGHAINLGMLGGAFVTTAILIWYNTWENKQRDAGKRDGRLSEGAEEELGYRHPGFRYTV